MRYMMMIKSDAETETGRLPTVEELETMGAYNAELVNAGLMLDGNGLQPSSKGYRIENVDGELTIHDGPFAESKELIAGYWIIQAKSLEEAVEWAKRVPFNPDDHYSGEGQIEVRRLYEMEDFAETSNETGWKEEEEALREEIGSHRPIGEIDPSSGALVGKVVYMGMVISDERSESGYVPDEDELQGMNALLAEGAAQGILLGGEGLRPSSEGARIYFSGGVPTVVDGPFAETKELIAGYALMQFDSEEQALEWAKRIVVAGDWKWSEFRRVFTAADFSELVDAAPAVFEQERQFREQAGARA